MNDIFTNLTTFIQNAITQAQVISPWLAAGAAVIFGLMYAFGGQQAAQFAKQRGIQMIVGLIIVWGVAALVNTLITLAGAGSNVNSISIGMVIDTVRMVLPTAGSYVMSLV